MRLTLYQLLPKYFIGSKSNPHMTSCMCLCTLYRGMSTFISHAINIAEYKQPVGLTMMQSSHTDSMCECMHVLA